MPFQVFVGLDVDGQRTVTIAGLQGSDTVAVLIQKLIDKEALDPGSVTLVFRAKQLKPESKLGDLGIKARSNLFAAFKVHGGMATADPSEFDDEGAVTSSAASNNNDDAGDGDARTYDIDAAKKLGIRPTKQNCFVASHEGCCKESVRKLMFAECDHVYCADCIFYYLNASICSNKKTAMTCADTGCGASFDIDATFVGAALTMSEVSKFEKQLNKNYLTVVCPNDKCKAYLLMDHVEVNKVQCSKCKGSWFCKICKTNWPDNSGSNYTLCGNPDCISMAEIFEALLNCPKEDHDKELQVPSLRICYKCHRYVTWPEACKHATCLNEQCKAKFCFVCLKKDHTCSLYKPCVVAEQTSMD